jgi:hypothetical protein
MLIDRNPRCGKSLSFFNSYKTKLYYTHAILPRHRFALPSVPTSCHAPKMFPMESLVRFFIHLLAGFSVLQNLTVCHWIIIFFTSLLSLLLAQPTCALQDRSGNHYCVLLCKPGQEDGNLRHSGDDGCGEATCQPIQGMGICTYAA